LLSFSDNGGRHLVPASAGSVFSARIEGLSHDGRGITRVEGKVWFVEGALPGETVLVKPTRGKRSYSLGIAQQLLERSPARVDPRCPAFGVCGGCALQHIDYGHQIEFKKASVIEALDRVGVEPPSDVCEISAAPWSYRRRARLGVRLVPKKGGVLVGFRERNKSFITPLPTCPVIHQSVDRVLPKLPALIERLAIPNRIPQIEIAAGENATALVFRHLSALTDNDVSRLREFGAQENLLVYTQAKGPDTAVPITSEGVPVLFYTLKRFDLKICFSATNFIQVNAEVNERIVGLVTDWLNPGDRDRVLDLFCGLGNFSLALARQSGEVIGVEGEPALVAQARENAAVNQIANARFEVLDLFDESIKDWRPGQCSHVLVDPPRSGAIEVLKVANTHIRPRMIAYVSCNSATFARDARYLTGSGSYQLTRLAVADMFPHTSQVETAALFVRHDGAAKG